MAPFIKHTRKTEHASGTKELVEFINAGYIAKAVYNDAEKRLTLIVAADDLGQKGTQKIEIHGNEAVAAMETIRDLT